MSTQITLTNFQLKDQSKKVFIATIKIEIECAEVTSRKTSRQESGKELEAIINK